MTRRALILALLAALPALLFAAYTYYYSDTLTSISGTYWTTNGTVTATSNGLTATSTNGGSIISLVAAPGNPNEYEVNTTLRLTASQINETYTHYLHASTDALNGPAPQGTYYAVEVTPTIGSDGLCFATMGLTKRYGGSSTSLGSSPVPCRDGMIVRSVIRSDGMILAYVDGYNYIKASDTTISSGQPGIGARLTSTGNRISRVDLGPRDSSAPDLVNAQTLATTAFPTSVEMQLQAPSDGANGVGVGRYEIRRNGVLIGYTSAPEFEDLGVTADQPYTYTIYAFDYHYNYNSSGTTFNVRTPPAGSINPRRIGVRSNGSYWGAGGEQIDMLSGNLNFTLPLLQAKGRGGLGAALALNYNSQLWRQDLAGTWRLGKDLGYGFGWRLMLGSLTPYWKDNFTLSHYTYTDSTGAEYRLDVHTTTGSGASIRHIWSSKEGIYVWYEANSSRLYFRDGTFWVMGSISAGTEQDAGTRYPTLIQDTNGNQIVVEYKSGLGVSWTNSSARVHQVRDVRHTTYTYQFNYNTDAIPHLTSVAKNITTSESYTFAYSAEQDLKSPFDGTQFGTTRMLNSVTTTGLNLTHQFEYGSNQAGELTKLTFPYGGYLKWTHASLTLSGGRTHREVQNRYLAKSPSATETQHILYRDSGDVNRTIHVGAWLADIGAPGMKKWGFLWSGTGDWYDGLQQQYEEMPAHWASPGTRLQEFTWARDAGLNPYISVATTTLNPGQYQKISKVEQSLDAYGWGNVLWTKIYNYGNLVDAARTYTNTYLEDTNHTNRYIRNRLLTTTLAGGGQSMTLVTNTYGGSYQSQPANIDYLTLHDATYGSTFYYRGNLTSRTVPGKPAAYFKYDIVGNIKQTLDPQGNTVDISSSSSNYVAPGVVTPNSNTNLASSFTYTSFLGIATATAPNASTTSYTYDATAQPSSTTSPHGAVTNYTYNHTALPATETATTNSKWVKKTKDGLGRVVLVEAGYGTTTVSKVTTEYAPCSCSPLGRVWRVSQPYTTSPTAWTTYTYDALGRTTCVSLPGNSGTTTYVYTGNIVRVTDPKLRWKEYETDVFGNVTKVTEPNPQGGANHETMYAYDMFNRLTDVTMPRSGTTQTRSFAYNTLGQLVTTANPENGTTTLAYNTDGSLFSKTDQKTQRIEYSYDLFRRVTQVRKYLPGYQTDDPCQRVNYYYDTNPYDGYFTQNGWGRLAAVEYGGRSSQYGCTAGAYREYYSYTAGGLPTKKKLVAGTRSLVGEWGYDSEGKMLSVKYPDTHDSQGNPVTGRTYTYSHDSMGRLSKLVDDRPGDPPGWEWVSTATYNVAGQLTYMNGWNGLTEYREYNERLQLTRINFGSDH